MNRTLEQRVQERTEELGARNRDMRLVLDNVNQGFLTISDEGLLAQEHSAIVETWFGAYEAPLAFWDYIARSDANFADMFQLGTRRCARTCCRASCASTSCRRGCAVGARDFSFTYRSIADDGVGGGDEVTSSGRPKPKRGVLIVVNDITAQLLRARQESEQAELMAMFQGFTADRTGFLSFFEEATRMLEALREGSADLATRKRPLSHDQGQRRAGRIRRGRAALSRRRGQAGRRGCRGRRGGSRGAGARWAALQTTLAELMRERGRDVIDVHARELDEVLKALRGVVPAAVWDRMADWRLEPAERPLTRLAEYARSLAQRLGRGDLDVVIEDNGLRLDPQHWSGLWSELVHVIRNAVDHGLERAEDRSAAQKPARPRLRLATKAVGDQPDHRDRGRRPRHRLGCGPARRQRQGAAERDHRRPHQRAAVRVGDHARRRDDHVGPRHRPRGGSPARRRARAATSSWRPRSARARSSSSLFRWTRPTAPTTAAWRERRRD